MSGKTPTSGGRYRLPNSSVAIQGPDGFVNHSWYLYLAQLGAVVAPGGTGLASLGVGPGLSAVDGSGVSASTLTTLGTLSLNLDYYGTEPGTLLARGSAAWEGVPPGGQGDVLTSAGPGELPFWGTSEEQTLPAAPPVGLLGNAGGASAPAIGITLTSLLDALFGASQGTVVFRGPSIWQGLAPGSVPGLLLATGGPNANPYWARTVVAQVRAIGTPQLSSPGNYQIAPLGFQDSSGNFLVLSDGLTG